MKPHKHALISLGYAGTVSFFAGNGAADPYVYLSALAGGTLIDFIDHPLFHLVYGRNEVHVAYARRLLFKDGIRRAIKYVNHVEDRRDFRGLALHNAFSLAIVSFLAIILSLFSSAPVYLFIFLGTFVLHMLMDIAGDFVILGHADNWLWVIPRSWITAFRNKGKELRISSWICLYVLPWLWLGVTGFFLTTARAGVQLAKPTLGNGLYVGAKHANWIWIIGALLLLLIFYALWSLLMCVATVRKYKLKVGNRVRFSLGSLNLLWRYMSGAISRNRINANRVYLRVEADCAIWSAYGIALTALALLLMTSLHWKSEAVFFLTPIFFALMFGTLIHTAVGELSGGFGVIVAWTLNAVLARLHLQEMWPLRRGFLLFLAAVVAWTVGLLGAVFLRGVSRMSVVAFVFEFSTQKEKFVTDARAALSLVGEALDKGYGTAHRYLLGNPKRDFLRTDPPPLLVQPYAGYSILGTKSFHLRATDSYSPIIQETAYAVCGNTLKCGDSVDGFVPVLPRRRTEDDQACDLHSSQASVQQNDQVFIERQFHWRRGKRPLRLTGPAFLKTETDHLPSENFKKSWAEFVDNFLTRRSTFVTDIFLSPSGPTNTITVCGIVRECTSTKEYATVEAEIYAGSVMTAIIELSSQRQIRIAECNSARLVYPRVSIFDEAVVKQATVATLPSEHSIVTDSQLRTINGFLDEVSPKKVLPYATADFGKKLVVLAFELAFTTMVVALGFNSDFVTDLLRTLVRAVR